MLKTPNDTPTRDFAAFSDNIRRALSAKRLDSKSIAKPRLIVYGNSDFSGWIHVVPISGYSKELARIAVCHYEIAESKLRGLADTRGELRQHVEISLLRSELVAPATADWLAGYIVARHRGEPPKPPPFALSEQFPDYCGSYSWSRGANRRSTIEHLTWPQNRQMLAGVLRGERTLADFTEAEMSDSKTFKLKKEVA